MTEYAVLWTDDDDTDRFDYEARRLAREGFQIEWANDVEAAARALSRQRFSALILDQMIAGKGVPATFTIWGGYRLLHWLRPPDLRQPLHEDVDGAWSELDAISPLGDNRQIPAVILSAFHNRGVLNATRTISPLNQAILVLSKPVDTEQLLIFLRQVREGKHP